MTLHLSYYSDSITYINYLPVGRMKMVDGALPHLMGDYNISWLQNPFQVYIPRGGGGIFFF